MERLPLWQDISLAIPAPDTEPDWSFWLNCYPALERAKNTPQDPIHHAEGDVWTHTCMVIRALLSSDDYRNSTAHEQSILFLAALLHDIAKADTTVIDPITGRIQQPGHSRRGAIDVRALLWYQGAPFDIREAICRLISVHQLPFFALQGADPVRRVHTLSWELSIRLLCALAEADIRGRISPDISRVLDDIELLRELAREEQCFTHARPYLNGYVRCQYARHHKGHPDYDLFAVPGSPVTVMCGLPASGKNYWVSQHCPDLPVVSFDDARTELSLRYGENDGAVAHRAIDKAKSLLRKQEPFVWNATHLSLQMRDKTLDLLYRYEAKVRIVYLEQEPQLLFHRNRTRTQTVPQKALERMLHRWEVPVPWEAPEVVYGG